MKISATIDTTTRKCGDCGNYEVLFRTPSGRPKKDKYGNCKGVVTLVKPISYHVTIEKKATWTNTDASQCPCFVRTPEE